MNDNWPDATEDALEAARNSIDELVVTQAGHAIPGVIGALIEWAVRNDATTQMARGLTMAVEMLPHAEAIWKTAPSKN